MTAQLPPNLLKLFIPRPPLPYLAPLDRDPEKRRRPVLTGVAEFLKRGEGHDVDYVPKETKAEEKKRKAAEKATRVAEALRKGLEEWKPNEDQEATADPYKTLFVARLPYETTEKTLRREFEAFGPIESAGVPVVLAVALAAAALGVQLKTSGLIRARWAVDLMTEVPVGSAAVLPGGSEATVVTITAVVVGMIVGLTVARAASIRAVVTRVVAVTAAVEAMIGGQMEVDIHTLAWGWVHLAEHPLDCPAVGTWTEKGHAVGTGATTDIAALAIAKGEGPATGTGVEALGGIGIGVTATAAETEIETGRFMEDIEKRGQRVLEFIRRRVIFRIFVIVIDSLYKPQ
ncbi:hypothetical protein HK104_000730 [Borealophlyctis nickersoniae]|nr:hypothetical protein HK104_000730 [Borealophlyctis nickersoniae]